MADLSGVPSTTVSGRTTPAGSKGKSGQGGQGGQGGQEQDFLALDIDGDRGESGIGGGAGGGKEGGYQQMQLVEQQVGLLPDCRVKEMRR